MNLEPQTLKYYEWTDVEAFLCEKMGISNSFKLTDDKNFFDVWEFLVNYEVYDQKVTPVWFKAILHETDKKETIDEFGEWVEIIFPAIEELQKEVNDKKINILYSF